MARWIGYTRKSWTFAATTSGRRIQARLAYLQMDETAVPEYPITDWIPTHATVDMQHYPQPGDANPTVRVGVVSASGGATVWVVLPIRAGQDYIPRFGWVDAKTLWVETLTRDHKHRIFTLPMLPQARRTRCSTYRR